MVREQGTKNCLQPEEMEFCVSVGVMRNAIAVPLKQFLLKPRLLTLASCILEGCRKTFGGSKEV